MAPDVADTVARVWRDEFGNASSVHHFGQRAKALVDGARTAVAALVEAEPGEIVFTSGGAEADNLAVRGVSELQKDEARPGIITSAIEHEAVLNAATVLGRRGWPVTILPVSPAGVVSP